jgi:hypothetical protein
LSSISGLLSVLGTVVFVLFLRKLATYIKSDDLVQQASGVLILCAGLIVFSVCSMVAMLVSELFGIVLGLIVVVMLFVACFRYFQLLSDMRLSLG